MAAISLFWDTNMVALMSFENALLNILTIRTTFVTAFGLLSIVPDSDAYNAYNLHVVQTKQWVLSLIHVSTPSLLSSLP